MSMPAVMKLAPGPGQVGLGERPLPQPGPGQVIIEVAAAGLCGTDLHILHDEFPTTPPVVLGHELAGRIAGLGEGLDATADGIEVGARVTSETYFSTCGRCRACREGRRNLCLQRRSIGSAVDGAFAPFVVVPAANVHRLPERVSDQAGALTEPLACVVHGVLHRASVAPGEVAVVAGPGAIGLLTLQVARAAGASVLMLGTSVDAERLALARRLGAVATVDVEREDPAGVLAEMAPDGADVVYECAGAGPAARQLIGLARRGGRYVQVGLFGRPVEVDLDQLCYRELTATGSNASTRASFRHALALLASGAVDTQPLVTDVFALRDVDAAFAAFEAKRGIKILFDPNA